MFDTSGSEFDFLRPSPTLRASWDKHVQKVIAAEDDCVGFMVHNLGGWETVVTELGTIQGRDHTHALNAQGESLGRVRREWVPEEQVVRFHIDYFPEPVAEWWKMDDPRTL